MTAETKRSHFETRTERHAVPRSKRLQPNQRAADA